MPEVFKGDEWKNCKEHPEYRQAYSRAEMQEKIDRDFGEGRITLQEWRDNTDFLSEP